MRRWIDYAGTSDAGRDQDWSEGQDSFRRKERVEQALKQAQEQVAAGSAERRGNKPATSSKARSRAQRERQQRLEQALEEFEKLAEQGSGKEKENRRVSTSHPQARVMKQPDGGFAPSYNVQIKRMRKTAWS